MGRTRLSSSTSDPALFPGVFGSAAVDAATSETAWLQAMLDVEAALAGAAARLGLVPGAAAAAIVSVCRSELFDLAELGRSWAAEATPVVALVRRLRELVDDDVRPFVHVVATSQDVVDTAMLLVVRSAVAAARGDVLAVTEALAALARQHRDTPQAGRTLLQQGAVTTFGAACATRLVAIDEAVDGLDRVLDQRLAVQLGGAVGTLAAADGRGPALVRAVADELGLREPVAPWHTSRGRVAELAAALGIVSGELAAVAQDLVLLSSTEMGEVSLAAPGASTAMPHKRNPAAAVLALAGAHRVPGLVATLLAGMPQELQRSTGRWQAEAPTMTDLLRLLGGVAHHVRVAVEGLDVDVDRMRAHVDHLLATTGVRAIDTTAAAAVVDRALAAHVARAPR
ncbi:MAG: lyase family protein [Actinomycetes bacterium]